jgi:hypothetical protein
VALVAFRPAPAPPADDFDQALCVVVETVIGILGAPVPPPFDASTTDLDATRRANEVLAQRRADIMQIPTLKEGC